MSLRLKSKLKQLGHILPPFAIEEASTVYSCPHLEQILVTVSLSGWGCGVSFMRIVVAEIVNSYKLLNST